MPGAFEELAQITQALHARGEGFLHLWREIGHFQPWDAFRHALLDSALKHHNFNATRGQAGNGESVERTVDLISLIDNERLSRLQLAIAAMLATLMALEGFDMQAMAFAAPQIIKEWGVSRAAMGPVLSASLLGYLVGALTLAAAGDRLGRKKIIVSGTLIFALFTLATAYAPSLSALLVLRFVAGLGLGGSIPTGVAFVSEYMPTRLRATTVGILYTVYALGGGLGGFLVAWTIPKFGWPSVFYIGGGLPLVIGLVLALKLPESVRL